MLADIEAGKVGTVIVKDMSRLGRNYLQVGMYTEMLFPQKGVRFIAINDGVDSAMGDNDFTPLRNLFNEWMVRDTSKKIKAVKKAKGLSGKPVTSKPVYGYLMDENENFIIDEEAAPVVRQIYQLCLAGNGPTKIARMLTEQEIPTPGTLEYQRTGSTHRYHPGYECKWATNTVVHILENREYTGCLVNFKTTTQSYKCSKIVCNPEDKQAIFENHHEPIIDLQTWEQVQSRIAELSRYIKRLYEDNVNGKISDERFMEMSADYEAEQRELKEKAAVLQGELDKAQEATVNAGKFMSVVRKYLSIEELTHTLLCEMVEKIVVYECEYDENEVRHQRIDIYYSFVGKIDLPEE